MKLKSSTPKDLMSEIKDMDIKMVDMRFTDMPGTTQHFTCLLYTSDAADE